MARRRARRGNKGKGGNGQMPWIVGGAVVVAIAAMLIFKPSSGGGHKTVSSFNITEYREKGGSTYIGNRYTLEGKVENIVSRGNDRLVSVSLAGNSRERLPLLVKGSSSVNLSRGDSFLFEVDCVTGQDAEGLPVKGIFVVKNVTIK